MDTKEPFYGYDENKERDSVIKAGYKQTEVGVIPEDWKISLLGDVCSKITDGTHDTPKPIERGVPFLTAIHVKENKIDFNSCYYLSQKVHDEIYKRCNPEINDVLMVNIGAGVATTALVNVGYEFSLKNVALLKPKSSKLSGSYLNYYQSLVKRKITETISTGGAQPFLSLWQIAQLKIALPPNKIEQFAIAKALSDTDALIQSLSQLIAKKRQIKQGAMQTLLNPYDETGALKAGWVTRQLREVLKIGHGRSQYQVISPNGQYPILASGGEIGRATSFLYDKPSVLIGRKGTIDVPQYMDKPFWTIDTLFYSEILKPNNAKYIFYQFCLIDWYSYNEASGVPSLSAKTIENIDVVMPSPNEQTQIAKTLTDMDTEVTALETKLSKYQKIKQGMMQDLLTGRIRLV